MVLYIHMYIRTVHTVHTLRIACPRCVGSGSDVPGVGFVLCMSGLQPAPTPPLSPPATSGGPELGWFVRRVVHAVSSVAPGLSCRTMTSVAAEMDLTPRGIPVSEWVSVFLIGWVVPSAIHVFIRPYARPIDLKDSAYTKPLLPDLVPSFPVLIASYAIPLTTVWGVEMFLLHRRSRVQHKPVLPLAELVLALFEANGLTVLITDILKSAAGRPRPHFAAVCGSYLASPPAAAFTCSGVPQAVDEARRSFPSGHSSLSMSAAVFTACYLAVVLRHCSGGGGAGGGRWRVWMGLIVAAPLLLAAAVAVSRTVDYHHHWSDIVAGATLGGGLSMALWAARFTDRTPGREGEAALPRAGGLDSTSDVVNGAEGGAGDIEYTSIAESRV